MKVIRIYGVIDELYNDAYKLCKELNFDDIRIYNQSNIIESEYSLSKNIADVTFEISIMKDTDKLLNKRPANISIVKINSIYKIIQGSITTNISNFNDLVIILNNRIRYYNKYLKFVVSNNSDLLLTNSLHNNFGDKVLVECEKFINFPRSEINIITDEYIKVIAQGEHSVFVGTDFYGFNPSADYQLVPFSQGIIVDTDKNATESMSYEEYVNMMNCHTFAKFNELQCNIRTILFDNTYYHELMSLKSPIFHLLRESNKIIDICYMY